MRINTVWFLTCLAVLFTSVLFAQNPIDNSPYSRFGMGNLHPSFTAFNGGMAGVGLGLNNENRVNLQNPASLAGLNYAALEVGVFGKAGFLTAGTEKLTTGTGNLDHLMIAFPIFNPLNAITTQQAKPVKWGMSLGLKPWSTVAYNVIADSTYGDIGEVTFKYQGSGGQYEFFWGNGVKYKNFSAGLQMSYIFGRSNYDTYISFNDLTGNLNDQFRTQINYSGFTYKGGLQYELDLVRDEDDKGNLKSKTSLTFGLTGNSAINLKTNYEETYDRLDSLYYGYDTLSVATPLTGKTKLPFSIGAGVGLQKSKKYFVGLDYQYTGWGSYSNAIKPETLENSYRIAVGGEYIPRYRDFENYRRRIAYRMGAFYETDPRVIDNQSLTNYGMTFGFGLPLKADRGVPSYFDIALEVGSQGNQELIKETYIKLNLGFTLNDNQWFFKRKFR